MEKLKQRLRAIAEEARALYDEFNGLAQKDTLEDAEETRFAELASDDGPIEALARERADIEQRLKVLETAQRVGTVELGEDRGVPQFMKPTPTDVDVRTASRGELRSAALKVAETEGKALAPHQQRNLEKVLSTFDGNTDGAEIARRLLITETPAYRSAFLKGVTQAQPVWTDEEARAVSEFRAMSIGTTTAGGFGVPVLIDPSIILTSGAADAPIIRIARQVTITTNIWKGVSSAGMSWSYDGEATEVSDDSPTLAQPSVTTYMARGFIPFSIEVGQDYPGFAEEMRELLNQGLLDLMAGQSATGSGTAPQGIFTAIDATAASEVSVTTAGALAAVDALKVWNALPERFKANASWVANTTNFSLMRQTAGDNAGLFTVDLSAGGIRQLLGRPVYETDYAPAFVSGTTSNQNVAVVGDFRNFLVALRAGMTIELVPHLVGTTSNRPTGERGWFAHTRHGFDSVNDNAFRLLKNP